MFRTSTPRKSTHSPLRQAHLRKAIKKGSMCVYVYWVQWTSTVTDEREFQAIHRDLGKETEPPA